MDQDKTHLSSDVTFRTLFEKSADAYLILESNTFVDCNQATVKMLRASTKEEVLSTHPSELSPEYQPDGRLSAEKADEMIHIALEQGSHRFEWVHRRIDGEDFPVEVLLTPMPFDNRQIIFTVWREIAERKYLERQLEESLKRRGTQVQIGTQVAQKIASAHNLNELFHLVVSLVKEHFSYYHVQLLRYDAHSGSVVLTAGYGEIGEKMLAEFHRLPMGQGLIGVAAASGETVLREDVTWDPTWKSHPLLPETRSEIAVPIKMGDEVLGVLDVQSDKTGALGPEDQLLLEGLCGQIAIAIESTRLREEMENRISELNTLYRATQREGWRSFIDTGEIVDGYIYDRLAVDKLAPEKFQTETVETSAVLQVRGENIGTLGVFIDPQHPLTEDEKHLVEQVSDQVAQALESARLFGQIQQVLNETQELYVANARLVEAQTIDDALLALVKATSLERFDQVIFEFFDQAWEEGMPKEMINAAVWERNQGESREPVGTIYQLADFPLFALASRDKPLVISDMTTDPRVDENSRKTVGELGIRGFVFWPLVAAGRWFGAVAGQSKNPLTLPEGEVRLISNLVGHAATVIQGLRLRQDMQDRLHELTALQRLMSRQAWLTYQSQMEAERIGYLFDNVSLQAITAEKLPGLEPNRMSSDTSTITAVDTMPVPVYTTPLTVSGEPIGALGIQISGSQALSPEDEIFLQAISDQVAQALERARLMEQTQRAAIELQAVAEVSTATSTILDPNELLQSVTDLTKNNFGLYHAHIYLVDDISNDLILAAGAGDVGRSMIAEGWVITQNDEISLVARTARLRQPQRIADVRKRADFLPNPLLPNTRSEMAIPIVVGDRLLGIFDVQADTSNRFTEQDERTYLTLASQVGVALQNAKLYAEQLATVDRLRELDNMKSAFLANMSHELRTPLNSILGFTQVIMEGLDGDLTDLMASDLELIEKNGKHLLNLINDVLDMAKIEAGRLTLNLEPLNLYELLDEVIVSSSSLARDKGLYVNLVADPMNDWVALVDHVRMRQIFINLIGNSIKFTERGGVIVDLERIWRIEESEQDRIRICFQDTGVGIPHDKLETVFEAFSQVDNTTTRKAGGTGLGLPISRRLVELHGGKLWAESEGISEEGSIFYLELPVGKNFDQ